MYLAKSRTKQRKIVNSKNIQKDKMEIVSPLINLIFMMQIDPNERNKL